MTTRSHCLLFHKRSTDWDSPLGYKQVISHYTRRISLLLTLVLGFASDSYNNNDILLVAGYNYNLYPTEAILQRHLQCNKSDIRQVLGNNYLLGSYSPVQCLIW